MTITEELFELLEFSTELKVRTSQGERMLSKASPTEEFWKLWKDEKQAIKDAGFSVSKDKKSGEWEVCLWREVGAIEPESAIKQETIAVSFDDSDDIPF